MSWLPRWLRLWVYKWTGQNEKYAEELARDDRVVKQVFNKAIEAERRDNESSMESAEELGLLVKEKQQDIKDNAAAVEHWTKVQKGSAIRAKEIAAQVVAKCKADGITDADQIKAAINGNAEYTKAGLVLREGERTACVDCRQGWAKRERS
jgi:hypothetical protein